MRIYSGLIYTYIYTACTYTRDSYLSVKFKSGKTINAMHNE